MQASNSAFLNFGIFWLLIPEAKAFAYDQNTKKNEIKSSKKIDARIEKLFEVRQKERKESSTNKT